MNSLQDFQTTNKLDHELILSSLPPTPSKSTAFTIEFDDLNNNQLKNNRQTKKFERNSLRDSLRKNAPEKLEKLTKLKDRTEDIKNVDTCKNLNFSTSLNQDRNLSDGASFLIQKMFSSDKLTKTNLTKSDTKSNKLSNKTNSKDYYSDTASKSCKSSPLKLNNYNNFSNYSNNFNKSSNFNSTNTDSGVNSSVCADDLENQSINKLNGYLKTDDDDNLSETGTYTVELDNQDPITEEARKRINDIFGVRETKYKLDDLKLNLDTTSTTSTSSSKPNSKHSFKISTIKPIYQTNNRTRQRHNSEKNLSTPKLNIKKENIIDNELQRKNSIKSINSSERLSFRNRKSSLQNSNLKRQDSFSKSSVSKLSVNNKSINTTTTTTTNKKSQNFNLINQNNTFVFNCNNGSPLLNRARANSISRCLTKNNTSTNIKTNKKTTKQQKLNDETNSIKSEEVSSNGSGTDLSSINSDKCKSDNGQISSLRFNRAFALRRARLGIDTPPIINSSKQNSNKPNNHLPTQTFANHSRSSSQCSATTTATYDHHRPIFDRSDGGRFSLRENCRSTIKPPINKQTKLVNNNKIIRQESSSSLINAIKTTKTNMVNKITKNTTTTTKTKTVVNRNLNKERTISNHVRANSFGGNNIGSNTSLSLNNNETIVLNNSNLNQLKQTSNLLSSAASTSSNNTLSNASTSEDLSNISDQLNNVKQLQNLSPFQLGRRIYSTKPHYIAQTNSLRTKLEENSNFVYQNGSFNDLNNQTTNQLNELPPSSLTSTKIETSKKKFGQLFVDSQTVTNNDLNNQTNSSNVKMLSALDYLVLGAVNQLSFKLRCKLRLILDTEKNKYPIDNDRRIIIEELLPQVNISEYRNSDSVSEKTISRDLSNVLKNLKRIEQSLEVINLLLESNSLTDKKEDDKLCNKDAILTNDDNFSLEI